MVYHFESKAALLYEGTSICTALRIILVGPIPEQQQQHQQKQQKHRLVPLLLLLLMMMMMMKACQVLLTSAWYTPPLFHYQVLSQTSHS
jgi:hypothetical protein